MRDRLKKKLGIEYARFKEDVLQLTPQEIYERSFQIDITWNLHEILQSLLPDLSEEEVRKLCVLENVIGHLFQGWLKVDDSCMDELRAYVKEKISTICKEKEVD